MKEMLYENFLLFEGVKFGAFWLTGMRKKLEREHFRGLISWMWPLPSNSDHQDYYIFSRGSL